MPSPSCTVRTTNRMVELAALSEATVLAVCGRQPSHLSGLVGCFGDPLGVRISSDSLMERINEDNLKKFVRGIFTNPIRIRGSQSPAVASSSLPGMGQTVAGEHRDGQACHRSHP